MKMLNDCYAKAIQTHTRTHAHTHQSPAISSEPLIMALLFSQHKMIEWLEGKISKPKINILEPLDESINAISQNYRHSD
jgi:hypothetical protein